MNLLSDDTRSCFVLTCTAGFEREAAAETAALVPGGIARPLFLKGNVLLEAACREEDAWRRIADGATEFLCTAVPVKIRFDVAADAESPAQIGEIVASICRPEPGSRFLVRCRRRGTHAFSARDVEKSVARAVERASGAVGEYAAPPATLVRVEIYQTRGYAGWFAPERLIVKHPEPRRRYAPGERPLNRAEPKLREAFEAFGLAPPTGRVLDLGAAPGGWTEVLAETAEEVVAVDPGALDERVLARPNVRHRRERAEAFLSGTDAGVFTMAVNDMNADPDISAQLLVTAAPRLAPGAPVVMTVKYPTRDRRGHREAVLQVLAAAFEDFRWARLPHNRQEVTLCARKKA